MAATQEDIGRLIVSIEANTKAYQTSLNKALGVTNKSAQQIEKRFSQMSTNIGKGFDLSSLTTALAAVGAGFTGKELIAYADAWTSLGNKIAAAGVPLEQVGARLNDLTAIANEARTPIDAIASLYARVTLSSGNLTASQGEIIQTVTNVSKAMTLSGASVLEMNSAILQFSQAIGSGVLQGDELRSLRENAPLIAQAIAKEFGVTIGELKKLGEEGKLTSDRVLAAIVNATDGINAAFAKTTPTIAQSATVLNNAFTQFIGTSGTIKAAADSISVGLLFLAKNFDEVATVAGALAIGFAAYAVAGAAATAKTAALAGTLLAMLNGMRNGTAATLILTAAYQRLAVASGLAGKGVGALTLALAKNPITLAVIAATAAGVALYTMGEETRTTKQETESLNNKLREATDAQTELGQVTRMLAEKDFAAATKAFGEMTGGADAYLQKRKELLQEQQRNALTEAVTTAFNVGGLNKYQLALERIDGRTNELRDSLIAAQMVGNAGLGISSEQDAAELAKIENLVAQTRDRLLKQESLKLGVDPAIYQELDRVRAEILKAVLAKNYSGAELILDKVLDDSSKIPEEIRASVIAPLLDVKKTLETLTGSNYAIKIEGENLNSFRAIVNGAAKSTSSLKDVLDNLDRYKVGDLGAREVAELTQASDGAKLRMQQLREEANNFGEGPLKRLAESGRVTLEFKAEIDKLIQSFSTGKITGEQFATALAQVGTQNPSMARFLTNLNQTGVQAAEGEAAIKKLAQAEKLIGKGGPTKFATDKPKERSEFQKQIDFLKAAASESNNRAEALRRLNPEAEKYNELLDAENQYLEKRRAIESAGKTVKAGSKEDNQLRAAAAQAAASKAAERQAATSKDLQRQFVLESAALGRQEQEYAKLNPTAADYVLQLAETDEYLKRMERRLSDGIPLLNGEAEAIRKSSSEYAKRKASLESATATGQFLREQRSIVAAAGAEIEVLSKLNPLSARYTIERDKAGIAAKMLAGIETDGVKATAAQRQEIENLSSAQAELNAQRAGMAAGKDLANLMQLEGQALTDQYDALVKLNPLAANYNVLLEAERVVQEAVNAARAQSRKLSEEEIEAIRQKAIALGNQRAEVDRLAAGQNATKDLADSMRLEGEALRDQYTTLLGLNPLQENYNVLLEAERVVQEAVNAARARGSELSTGEIENIREKAIALGNQRKVVEDLATQQQAVRDISSDAMKGFIRDVVKGESATKALSNALSRMADRLLDMALDRSIMALLGGFGGGNAGTFASMLFGRATGGPVNAGTPYVVGESGREVFVPNRDGRIIPNKDLKGGAGSGGSTTVNISNYSGQNVQQQSRRDGNREIIDVVIGEVSRRMAGGDFDKSMGNRYGGMPRTIAR